MSKKQYNTKTKLRRPTAKQAKEKKLKIYAKQQQIEQNIKKANNTKKDKLRMENGAKSHTQNKRQKKPKNVQTKYHKLNNMQTQKASQSNANKMMQARAKNPPQMQAKTKKLKNF